MTDHPSRREFVRTVGVGVGAAFFLPSVLAGCRPPVALGGRGTAAAGWAMVPEILARIKAPTFPDRDVSVTAHGARGDGTTDCTKAFADAIAACHGAGGGRVVVPAGRYLTGPIHLRSNVNLHVTEGATIAFSTDPKAYLPAVFTRWEGMELMGYSPLIYAFEQENVAVTGKGTLDGQASETHWWPWKGQSRPTGPTQTPARNRLHEDVAAGKPVAERLYGDGSYLRPQFIQPYRCRNVLVEDVRIINSPMWEIHPVLCTNVTVRGARVETAGPNNDGCNPESCRDVLIENCLFDTGDDCIAIKSGRNADGRRINVPSENIVIRGCRMKEGHGGVTIGSEISGGVRHVYVERCEMDSPVLDRALRFKNNAARGGVLEHIYMRDVTVGQVADAVLSIDLHYEEGAKGTYVPVVRDVEMRNVTSRKSEYGLYARAYER
ncbi:MAG TPA: glycoside hydrolase family 28 protein, partial [Gemmatimonadaceae bacterium]|nr:glycoside hydrolase family 28 protein [Gemmatimonadaceae bacterium]